MTREEFYKLTDILNSEVLGNFMHGGEADELIAMFEEAVEHSNILEQEEPVSEEWIEELRTKLDSMSKEDFKKVFDKYAADFNEELANDNLEKIVEEIAEPTILNAYGTKELARRLRNTIDISASEDLEEVAKIYTLDDSIKPWRNLTKEAFIAGAKWQKGQFEKDYTSLCNGIATAKGLVVAMAYDKGMADAREQMMENTTDAMIGLPYENKDGGYTHLIDVSRPLPVGNNKITIIFKEE